MPKEKAISQLTPFHVGQVKAHMDHGLGAPAIAARVLKNDGVSTFGVSAITNCMQKLREDPTWQGERAEGSGRPRKTTKSEDERIVNWLLKTRGKRKVGVPQVKRRFKFLKGLSNSLIEERLHEANLSYLRRRRKSIVTKKYLQPRIKYCESVKRMHADTLLQWAYTDGTVFYLDRTEAEHEETQVAALGSHVWRRSDQRDALFHECIGPSSYNKAQGTPVRVWGMLASGKLHIYVLEEGETMDKFLYAGIVEEYFDKWRGGCNYLVCDYERCLRTDEALAALRSIDLQLVKQFPRCSQDFNAIENVWKILRDRLMDTLPVALESRTAFIKRLRDAVKWVNQNRAGQLRRFSTNQRERAEECLKQKPKGGRIKW